MAVISAAAMALSCQKNSLAVTSSSFGRLSTGEEVTLYHLTNSNGASMDVIDFGCRIVKICVPDRNGVIDDVVVGPGDLETFEKGDRFMGCVIGRYGNRINHSSFTLDGVKYDLVANENLDGEPVQCHGGVEGFDTKMWESEAVTGEGRVGVRMHRISPDGEQGYPGNLECCVTYWLDDSNTVKVEYEAETDAPTVLNLSNHTYFNMKGSEGGYIMDHQLQVEADQCVQNNLQYCPDLILPVEDTPFDFREPHRVDYRIDMPSRHLEIMHGMSACWLVRDWDGSLRKASDVYEPRSGRGMETWTTEPALLTYTARGFSAEKYKGKYGPIDKFGGMLFETLHPADCPNQDRFPSTVLRPGEKYYSTTEFRFYTR